jgi:hypothetical protein
MSDALISFRLTKKYNADLYPEQKVLSTSEHLDRDRTHYASLTSRTENDVRWTTATQALAPSLISAAKRSLTALAWHLANH